MVKRSAITFWLLRFPNRRDDCASYDERRHRLDYGSVYTLPSTGYRVFRVNGGRGRRAKPLRSPELDHRVYFHLPLATEKCDAEVRDGPLFPEFRPVAFERATYRKVY